MTQTNLHHAFVRGSTQLKGINHHSFIWNRLKQSPTSSSIYLCFLHDQGKPLSCLIQRKTGTAQPTSLNLRKTMPSRCFRYLYIFERRKEDEQILQTGSTTYWRSLHRNRTIRRLRWSSNLSEWWMGGPTTTKTSNVTRTKCRLFVALWGCIKSVFLTGWGHYGWISVFWNTIRAPRKSFMYTVTLTPCIWWFIVWLLSITAIRLVATWWCNKNWLNLWRAFENSDWKQKTS